MPSYVIAEGPREFLYRNGLVGMLLGDESGFFFPKGLDPEQ